MTNGGYFNSPDFALCAPKTDFSYASIILGGTSLLPYSPQIVSFVIVVVIVAFVTVVTSAAVAVAAGGDSGIGDVIDGGGVIATYTVAIFTTTVAAISFHYAFNCSNIFSA